MRRGEEEEKEKMKQTRSCWEEGKVGESGREIQSGCGNISLYTCMKFSQIKKNYHRKIIVFRSWK